MHIKTHLSLISRFKLITGTILFSLLLVSCGESSTSKISVPVTATRYAHECVALSTGAVPITIKNTCDFNIIFRELPDETPITVIVESEEQYTPKDVNFNFGVCKAPYSPAILENNTYDCR